MRLLNAETKKLEEFIDDEKIPPYAILSHTWGPDELTYHVIAASSGPFPANTKIDGCCKIALSDGLRYVWIDTICIDKSSSAELSEAINSMFRWYKDSSVCYAFLSDVSCVPDADSVEDNPDYFMNHDSEFCKSKWFTRGWTLQELLAPKAVLFYDQNWHFIAPKQNAFDYRWWRERNAKYKFGPGAEDFHACLARITGIPRRVLLRETKLGDVCVAAKMAWAANRKTTRKEDIAYCLMGLFDVNMAMLYGEGDRAFIRLQEEIIRKSDDESIFAWGFRTNISDRLPTHPQLLAPSPVCFAGCGGLWKGLSEPNSDIDYKSYWERDTSSHYSITNKGLLVERRLLVLPAPFNGVIMPLNCSAPDDVPNKHKRARRLALPLRGDARDSGRLWPDMARKPLLVDEKLFYTHGTPALRLYVDTEPRRHIGAVRILQLRFENRWGTAKRPQVVEIYPTWFSLKPSTDLDSLGFHFLDLYVQNNATNSSNPARNHVMLRVLFPNVDKVYMIHLMFGSDGLEAKEKQERWLHYFKESRPVECGVAAERDDGSLIQQIINTPTNVLDSLDSVPWPRTSKDGRVSLKLSGHSDMKWIKRLEIVYNDAQD